MEKHEFDASTTPTWLYRARSGAVGSLVILTAVEVYAAIVSRAVDGALDNGNNAKHVGAFARFMGSTLPYWIAVAFALWSAWAASRRAKDSEILLQALEAQTRTQTERIRASMGHARNDIDAKAEIGLHFTLHNCNVSPVDVSVGRVAYGGSEVSPRDIITKGLDDPIEAFESRSAAITIRFRSASLERLKASLEANKNIGPIDAEVFAAIDGRKEPIAWPREVVVAKGDPWKVTYNQIVRPDPVNLTGVPNR